MNVFSSDGALAALAIGLGADPTPVGVRVGGHTFRTVRTRRGRVCDHEMVDFLEPTEVVGDRAATARFLPRVSVRAVPAAAWTAVARPELEPAPFVDWSTFDSWSDFERYVSSIRSKVWADARRCSRKLATEQGELRFVADDHSDEAWNQCLRWKEDQYARTGAPNHFEATGARRYLDELRRRGLTRVSSLRAGDTLVAAHIGLHHAGRHYYWLPAFDAELRALSPGRILLHELLRSSHDADDREFDFLLGDEDYKWYYATHARVIEPLGSPGPIARARQLRTTLPRRHPELQRQGRRALQWARRRRARLTRARTPRS